jgi:hypothetical protein
MKGRKKGLAAPPTKYILTKYEPNHMKRKQNQQKEKNEREEVRESDAKDQMRVKLGRCREEEGSCRDGADRNSYPPPPPKKKKKL